MGVPTTLIINFLIKKNVEWFKKPNQSLLGYPKTLRKRN
jgi:hypothetical protein